MTIKPLTTELDLLNAIERTINYNWEEEERDYQENKHPQHIYLTLVQLDTWVRRRRTRIAPLGGYNRRAK